MLAIGACFNESADSHLICVQGEDGQYQTQAISIHNQPRKGGRQPKLSKKIAVLLFIYFVMIKAVVWNGKCFVKAKQSYHKMEPQGRMNT